MFASELLWAVHPNLKASSTFFFSGLWAFTLNTKLAVKAAGLSMPDFPRNIMVLEGS